MERQRLVRTYLAHHELESVIIIIVVVVAVAVAVVDVADAVSAEWLTMSNPGMSAKRSVGAAVVASVAAAVVVVVVVVVVAAGT